MRCTIATSSSTRAYAARRALKQNGVPAETVRIPPGMTSGGCGFGVAVECGELDRAIAALRMSDVIYGDVLRDYPAVRERGRGRR